MVDKGPQKQSPCPSGIKSSATSGEIKPSNKVEGNTVMPDKTEQKTNYDRLLGHLQIGSLAYRLVQAKIANDSSNTAESMKAILMARLEQTRGHIENCED